MTRTYHPTLEAIRSRKRNSTIYLVIRSSQNPRKKTRLRIFEWRGQSLLFVTVDSKLQTVLSLSKAVHEATQALRKDRHHNLAC